ncbi:MAG: hypothetical protein ACK4NY_19910 [Spirosomataceae bacterium]
MKNIKAVTCEDDVLRNIYIENYRIKANADISIDYLKRSTSVLIYHGETPIGGYCINGNNFRYLDVFKAWQKKDLLKRHNVNENDFLEITCIWIASKTPIWLRCVYYSYMLKDTMEYAKTHRKKYVLGGSIEEGIQKDQQKVLRKILYKGFISNELKLIGKETKKMLLIYYNTIGGFVSRSILFIVNRMFSTNKPPKVVKKQARKGARRTKPTPLRLKTISKKKKK